MKQVFISYKSENVNDVRLIIEELIGRNVPVWFAEYEVLANNYDNFTEKLNEHIFAAINSSDYWLIFTNDKWADSLHCQNESRRIYECQNLDNVIQICIPRERKTIERNPWLAEVFSIDFDHENINKTIDLILRRLGVHISISESFQNLADLKQLESYRFRFGHINIGGLSRISMPRDCDPITKEHLLKFSGRIESSTVGLEINYNPYRTAITPLGFTLDERSTVDDRSVYFKLRKRAINWYEATKYSEKGLHLFHWNSKGHMAITYKSRSSHNHVEWLRTYALVTKDPKSEKHNIGEIDLTFTVKPDCPEASFSEFCKIAKYLDTIANSFVFTGNKMVVKLPPKPLIYIVSVFGAITGALVWHHMFDGVHTFFIGGVLGYLVVARVLDMFTKIERDYNKEKL